MNQIATLTPLLLLLLLPAGILGLDVIVVGAGISGLTAGRTLQQQGHSVTLLEADPGRYGGRVRTRTDLVPEGTRKLLITTSHVVRQIQHYEVILEWIQRGTEAGSGPGQISFHKGHVCCSFIYLF